MDRFDLAARGSDEGLWDWNLTDSRVHYSRRWISMLGHEEEEFGNGPADWFDRIHPEDIESVRRAIEEHLANGSTHFEIQHRLLHKDGSYRWMICRGIVTRDETGRAVRIAGCHSDVTGEKVADPLTGLPNRVLLQDRLAHAVEVSKRRSDFLFAVMILDLDRPESLLERLGSVGCELLVVAAARRLETCLRAGDTVARPGSEHLVARSDGDQFIILIEGLREVEEAKSVAERLLKEISAPYELDGREVFLTASIGIALSATGYRNADESLRDADIALYRAKSLGKSRCEVFDTAVLESTRARIQLETDLRGALERQEFAVLYQPIVSLTSHQIVGFEALLRWQHPVRGIISPSEFIPSAEKTGFIVPLGRWVLGQACRQLKVWRADASSCSELWVSVNLSSLHFMQPSLVREIRGILLDLDLDARDLVLEVTESAVLGNPEATSSVLMQLRVMGAQIAIDDFGTGYSSLARLRQLPIDILKIDHSFVRSIESSRDSLEIVGAICSLGHQLGLRVIAEGIENVGQLHLVQSLSCEFGQGFFFSGAVTGAEAATLLRDGFASSGSSNGSVLPEREVEETEGSRSRFPPAFHPSQGRLCRKKRRHIGLKKMSALTGLAALLLVLLGGLWTTFNRPTSSPSAYTSAPGPAGKAETLDASPAPKPPDPEGRAGPPPAIPNPAKKIRPASAYTYPVVHDHVWGSCKGDLKITRDAISFVSQKEKDSLDYSYSDCAVTLEGDWLVIKAGSKTYRFKSATAETKEENRKLLQQILQSISRLRRPVPGYQ